MAVNLYNCARDSSTGQSLPAKFDRKSHAKMEACQEDVVLTLSLKATYMPHKFIHWRSSLELDGVRSNLQLTITTNHPASLGSTKVIGIDNGRISGH